MTPFQRITTTAVPLPIEDVDTDQIIPARFLKATTREGFGENLFRDWRFDQSGHAKPDFVLNNPLYTGQLLLTGRNFGCGSSREHAAWAIFDYGFRVVVSSFFADIFRANALNNGLLPVQVAPDFLDRMFRTVEAHTDAAFTVDLEQQSLRNESSGEVATFEIDPYKKECMLKGYDDIDYLLSMRERIADYERERAAPFT